MMLNPRLGQPVRVRYARHYARHMPLHDRVGSVVIVSRGRPRNHGVRIDGVVYAIPCGNLCRQPKANSQEPTP